MDVAQLEDTLVVLADEVRELYLGETVQVLDGPPSALEFARLVASNRPALIRNAISHWPALSRWSNEYLRARLGSREVTVAVTPHGLADSIVVDDGTNEACFAQPLYEKMPFADFLTRAIEAEDPVAHGVHYIQLQNDSLRLEFPDLLEDIDVGLRFATEALGREPEAVNFWMGEDHSVTSLHKDHYENLYAVIAGEKHFTLYPPTDLPFLYERPYPSAEYVRDGSGGLRLRRRAADGAVPWISVDPLSPDFERFPLLRHARPLHVTVRPGELLYLPSLFFHHVRQSADADGRCVAVNFWFDMEYDLKYAYFGLLRALAQRRDHQHHADGLVAAAGNGPVK